MNKEKLIKIYKYTYDNNLDENGKLKENEFLGEFNIIDGDDNGYDYEMIGIKDNKKYKIIGTEISYLYDSYHAGTENVIYDINTFNKEKLIKWLEDEVKRTILVKTKNNTEYLLQKVACETFEYLYNKIKQGEFDE